MNHFILTFDADTQHELKFSSVMFIIFTSLYNFSIGIFRYNNGKHYVFLQQIADICIKNGDYRIQRYLQEISGLSSALYLHN